MADPAPRKSYLILILVVLAAFVVVIAKTSAKKKTEPESPTQASQTAADNAVARIAAAVPPDSTRVGAPEPAAQPPAADEPQATAKPTPPNEAAPAPKPEPAAAQPPAAEPKPEHPVPPDAEPGTPQEPAAPQEPAKKEVKPLPGSKLDEALKSGIPTMVDFGAGWCRACKLMEPVLVEAATKYEGRANVVYVDTDNHPQLARSYRIASIPTQIFFDAKGEKVSQHIGYWPIEDVARALAAAGVAE